MTAGLHVLRRRASRDAFLRKSDGPSESPRNRRTSPVDAPSSYPLMATTRSTRGFETSRAVSAPDPRPPENNTTRRREPRAEVDGTRHYGTAVSLRVAMHSPIQAEQLEHVRCAVCGADDYEVIYEAQYHRQADADLVRTFRASGDELLIDQLVRCRQCTFQYVTPRLRGDLIFGSYTEGDDHAYVSQLQARERTFDVALRQFETALGSKGRLLDIGTAAGAFVGAAAKRGWDAEGCESNRWLAQWGAAHYGI